MNTKNFNMVHKPNLCSQCKREKYSIIINKKRTPDNLLPKLQ